MWGYLRLRFTCWLVRRRMKASRRAVVKGLEVLERVRKRRRWASSRALGVFLREPVPEDLMAELLEGGLSGKEIRRLRKWLLLAASVAAEVEARKETSRPRRTPVAEALEERRGEEVASLASNQTIGGRGRY